MSADETAAVAAPAWDLSDLYRSPDDPVFEADFKAAEAQAGAFAERAKGRLAAMSGVDLAAAIGEYEAIQERLGRLLSYVALLYQADASDAAIAKLFGDAQARATELSTALIFFTLELNRIEDDALEAKLAAAPELAHWRPWLRERRAMRPHQLSDEIETVLHEQSMVGSTAWVRLFDETVAGLRFDLNGAALTIEETLDKLQDKDRDLRRDAAGALAKTFGANDRLFALIMNTTVKDKELDDRRRGFKTPEAFRHLSNQVEAEVVDALEASVRAAFPRLSHRYYAMKARWLGHERLEHWDRNAPLPAADDDLIPWERARDTVLGAYGDFAPEMAATAKRFFDHGWIDAAVRPGKASGAFAHPTVPSAHPFVLMNYLGKPRDVMTLAHELGHGVHQVLAAPKGLFLSNTPLTLAETASVFGEMLTFRALLAAETDPAKRKALLASKVEDMLNTVVRQTAFYGFERRIHAERAEGELTAARIGEIWIEVQGESLGPAIHLGPGYETYWSYISHFIHAPFYVYAYAFGDCLVNSLYAVYRDAEAGFAERYLDMLRAGGTLRHKELLAPFGLDATDPAFWDRGLAMIEGLIDELAEMDGV